MRVGETGVGERGVEEGGRGEGGRGEGGRGEGVRAGPKKVPLSDPHVTTLTDGLLLVVVVALDPGKVRGVTNYRLHVSSSTT